MLLLFLFVIFWGALQKSSGISAVSVTQVKNDVPRTFANVHDRFNPDMPGNLQPVLERLLLASVALQDEYSRSYWQGFNYIAGFTLLIIENEEKAFWTFNALLRGPLAAIFGPEGPNVEVFLMDEMLQERIPALCQHLLRVGIPLRTYTTQWMVCAFTTALPPETTLRVWDFIILSAADDAGIIGLWPDAMTQPSDVATDGPPAPTGPAPSLDVWPQHRDVIGSNLIMLICLAVLQLLHKEIIRQPSPDKVNEVMKAALASLYDDDLLLDTSLELASGDHRGWSPTWSLSLQFQAVRLRASRLSKLQDSRMKKFRRFRNIFRAMTRASAAKDTDPTSPRRARSAAVGVEKHDFTEFFRELYVESPADQKPCSSMSPARLHRARMSSTGETGETQPFGPFEDAAWVPEAEAFFRMIDGSSSGDVSQQEFAAMATAFPHLLQHFEPDTNERAEYSSTHLRSVFEAFDSNRLGVLSMPDVFNLIRKIHVCAGRLNGAVWARDATLSNAPMNSSEPMAVESSQQCLRWTQEAGAIYAIAADPMIGLSFKDFQRCTVLHPTIAIGICLLRTTDVGKPAARRTSVNTELLSSDDPNITTGSTLIRLSRPGTSQSSLPFANHLLSEARTSAHQLTISITGVEYVKSDSFLETFVSRGYVRFTLKIASEVSVKKNPECTHRDFLRLCRDRISRLFLRAAFRCLDPNPRRQAGTHASNSPLWVNFVRARVQCVKGEGQSQFLYCRTWIRVSALTPISVLWSPHCTHVALVDENLTDEYPKETRLTPAELDMIKSFPLPARPLARFAPEDLLARKNTWKHFLDIVQTIDSTRVRVCLTEMME